MYYYIRFYMPGLLIRFYMPGLLTDLLGFCHNICMRADAHYVRVCYTCLLTFRITVIIDLYSIHGIYQFLQKSIHDAQKWLVWVLSVHDQYELYTFPWC